VRRAARLYGIFDYNIRILKLPFWFSAPFLEYQFLFSDVTASFWCAEHADHREEGKATSVIMFSPFRSLPAIS